jgi:hypothetical protein
MNVEPDRVVTKAQKLLRKLTSVVAEEMAISEGQDKHHVTRDHCIRATARADQVGLLEVQQENDQLQLEIEQQLVSSSGQMLEAQQENDRLRMKNDCLRRIIEELQEKVDEISGDFVAEVTLKEGRGRRSTMLRNKGNTKDLDTSWLNVHPLDKSIRFRRG